MKKNVYMDAAASWLKPQSVIGAQVDFLSNHYANAGRGVCERAGAVDTLIENVRGKVADFIGAASKNIVWTSGATDGLNRIANIISSQPGYNIKSTIVVSDLEHHSARMPWEALKHVGKAGQIFVCDLDENNNIKIDSIPYADVFVITAMSNVLGVPQDVGAIIRAVRDKNPNVITIVDASQYVAHKRIDVKKWDCDFLVFSGHKIGADTGVGVMYIRDVDKYYPDKFGGGMVNKIISDSNWVLNDAPQKFEAGTLPLTQIIGLSHAIDELQKWSGGTDLIHYMYDELLKIDKIKMLSMRDACILSFIVEGMHPLDFGVLMGANDICIRVGNMCASWIHKRLGINGSIRLSVGPWNTMADAEYVVETIRKLVK